jgi:hypothetical protein
MAWLYVASIGTRDSGEAQGGFNGNIEALDHFELVRQFRDQHLDCTYRNFSK